jgi:hypothetical protein
MKNQLKGWNLFRILYLIVLLIIMIIYFSFRALHVVYGMGDLSLLQWNFLAVSLMISLLAFINYLLSHLNNQTKWQRYTLLLLIAMLFGSLSDFFLGGFIPLPLEPLYLGVVAFAIGQIFYLIALRNLSPLVITSKSASPSQPCPSKRRIVMRSPTERFFFAQPNGFLRDFFQFRYGCLGLITK